MVAAEKRDKEHPYRSTFGLRCRTRLDNLTAPASIAVLMPALSFLSLDLSFPRDPV